SNTSIPVRLASSFGWAHPVAARRARTRVSSSSQRASVCSAVMFRSTLDLLVSTSIAGTISSMDSAVKPKGCTNLKLRQLSRVVTRHYDRFVAATGLRNTQYSLLSHVVLSGPIRPSDLAHRMRLDASTLTRNLQPLLAQGWLRQGPGEDARSRLVEATKAGRAKRVDA